MTIPATVYSTLLSELGNYADPHAYASDMALSSIWADREEDIPPDRFPALAALHGLATMPFGDLIRRAGLTQRAFSDRFGIPKRTVESWCSSSPSARECPLYTRMMICECLGLLPMEVR